MENYKVFKFVEKNDFIIYLREVIYIAYKMLKDHRRYLTMLEKEIERYKVLTDENAKIPPYVYEDTRNLLKNVTNSLLNLFSDEGHSGTSYKKFRTAAESKKKGKRLGINLEKLSEEHEDILEQFHELRNWSSHVPESLIVAQLEMAKRDGFELRIDKDIQVASFEYYEGAWLISLYNEQKHIYEGFCKIFQQAKKDYSVLVGESMRIKRSHFPVRHLEEEIEIPKISLEMQLRQYEKKFK
ncbi:hypothetical protein P4S95_09345 [Aneurinibacillus aneurinilyticus]|uniref:hypothetical protein n=1 Tax=Aneurinibacillus aneurinilyticus TaxID=1391 RepID=UPI002E1F2C99|nr:hypothetical protein [Aneurinibacillus aneurinilyticus]